MSKFADTLLKYLPDVTNTDRDQLTRILSTLEQGTKITNLNVRGGSDIINAGALAIAPQEGLLLQNPLTGRRTVNLEPDGDALFGSDITLPASTSLVIFSNSQRYNGEAVGFGDVMMGDNTSGKANLLWDRSTGQLKFRGGVTTQAYIDTNGKITAGGGAVTLDTTGITATAGLIAGWTISTTQIKKTGIILDSSTDKILVGAATPRIELDGANKKITVGSTVTIDGAAAQILVGSAAPRITLDGATKVITVGSTITVDGAAAQILVGSAAPRITLDGATKVMTVGATITLDGAAAKILIGSAAPRIELDGATKIINVGSTIDINGATAQILIGAGLILDGATQMVLVGSADPRIQIDGANKWVQSNTFVAGTSGFRISGASGDAEFNNIIARGELRSHVFSISEIQANAGTLGVFDSAGSVNVDFSSPAAILGTVNAQIKNSPAGGSVFAVNDIVRIKGWNGSGVRDSWYTVTVVGTNSGTYTTYTLRLESGTLNWAVRAGMAVVGYGPANSGYIMLSADGTYGSSSNMSIVTHAGAPWTTQTLRMRLGNMNGSYGAVSTTYGFGVGDYASGNYLSYNAETATELVISGANGNLKVTSGGMVMVAGTTTPTKIRWTSGANDIGIVSSDYVSGSGGGITLTAKSPGATDDSNILLDARKNDDTDTLRLWGHLDNNAPANKRWEMRYTNVVKHTFYEAYYQGQDIRLAGGMVVGSTVVDPAAGTLEVTGLSKLNSNDSGVGIQIGSDTQIYRSAANVLTTPDALTVGGQLKATLDGLSGGVVIGTDTQWYRSAADVLRTPDSVIIDGDLYSVDLTDYSATSTITGWASFTTKKVWYKKVGKRVDIWFALSGTSNATTISFTLPYTASNPANAVSPQTVVRGSDNGGAFAVALAVLSAGTSTINVYKTLDGAGGAAWTNTGTKEVFGSLSYESA